MLIDKDHVLTLLSNIADEQTLERARQQLPDLIETRRYADQLAQLGLDPAQWESDGRPGADRPLHEETEVAEPEPDRPETD